MIVCSLEAQTPDIKNCRSLNKKPNLKSNSMDPVPSRTAVRVGNLHQTTEADLYRDFAKYNANKTCIP